MGTGSWLRRHWVEALWAVFAAANVAVMVLLTDWETIPFHLVWVSLTLVFGLRMWRPGTTWTVLAAVTLVTGAAMVWVVLHGRSERLDELSEVPLMAAVFMAMAWHANRRRAATDEVRRLAESEHRLLESQREFLRSAAHVLRTPITVARGHAELIRASGSGDRTSEDADVILDELRRLSRIAERLLILTAAEHPGFLHRAPLELEPFVVHTARRWAATANRRWEVHAEADGHVPADEERLAIALDALVENALKFTADGDQVSIGARADGNTAVLEVSDGGRGIRPQDLSSIFDPFVTADGAADGGRGTGLGLPIVRAIAEAHGGSVEVSSPPGRGSTFAIRLPGFLPTPAGVPARGAGRP